MSETQPMAEAIRKAIATLRIAGFPSIDNLRVSETELHALQRELYLEGESVILLTCNGRVRVHS